MVRYIFQRELRNGTIVALLANWWYFGLKAEFPDLAGRGAAYKGWLWGWYRAGIVGQFGWKFNWGRFRE